jgi:hypothetical protein
MIDANALNELIEKLQWEDGDDIVLEIGGTIVSGIHQPPGANPKWSTPYGERKYNKDAFIVIKNKSRDPFIPSKPPEDV